jgi:hypothetical protein
MRLGLAIERGGDVTRGGFIEQQNPWQCNERAPDRHPLHLTSGYPPLYGSPNFIVPNIREAETCNRCPYSFSYDGFRCGRGKALER